MIERHICPQCGFVTERHKNPLPTVDVIVNVGGKIVLVKRKNAPLCWALPGGFVDYGESAEDAAVREIREETGLEIEGLRQFRCYSDPDRDPRFHTLTVVFIASAAASPVADDDAAEAACFSPDCMPFPLAFDHDRIINDYLASQGG